MISASSLSSTPITSFLFSSSTTKISPPSKINFHSIVEIVSSILQFLPLADVVICCRVSKFWSEISRNILLPRKTVDFLDPQSRFRVRHNISLVPELMSKVLAIQFDSTNCAFRVVSKDQDGVHLYIHSGAAGGQQQQNHKHEQQYQDNHHNDDEKEKSKGENKSSAEKKQDQDSSITKTFESAASFFKTGSRLPPPPEPYRVSLLDFYYIIQTTPSSSTRRNRENDTRNENLTDNAEEEEEEEETNDNNNNHGRANNQEEPHHQQQNGLPAEDDDENDFISLPTGMKQNFVFAQICDDLILLDHYGFWLRRVSEDEANKKDENKMKQKRFANKQHASSPSSSPIKSTKKNPSNRGEKNYFDRDDEAPDEVALESFVSKTKLAVSCFNIAKLLNQESTPNVLVGAVHAVSAEKIFVCHDGFLSILDITSSNFASTAPSSPSPPLVRLRIKIDGDPASLWSCGLNGRFLVICFCASSGSRLQVYECKNHGDDDDDEDHKHNNNDDDEDDLQPKVGLRSFSNHQDYVFKSPLGTVLKTNSSRHTSNQAKATKMPKIQMKCIANTVLHNTRFRLAVGNKSLVENSDFMLEQSLLEESMMMMNENNNHNNLRKSNMISPLSGSLFSLHHHHHHHHQNSNSGLTSPFFSRTPSLTANSSMSSLDDDEYSIDERLSKTAKHSKNQGAASLSLEEYWYAKQQQRHQQRQVFASASSSPERHQRLSSQDIHDFEVPPVAPDCFDNNYIFEHNPPNTTNISQNIGDNNQLMRAFSSTSVWCAVTWDSKLIIWDFTKFEQEKQSVYNCNVVDDLSSRRSQKKSILPKFHQRKPIIRSLIAHQDPENGFAEQTINVIDLSIIEKSFCCAAVIQKLSASSSNHHNHSHQNRRQNTHQNKNNNNNNNNSMIPSLPNNTSATATSAASNPLPPEEEQFQLWLIALDGSILRSIPLSGPAICSPHPTRSLLVLAHNPATMMAATATAAGRNASSSSSAGGVGSSSISSPIEEQSITPFGGSGYGANGGGGVAGGSMNSRRNLAVAAAAAAARSSSHNNVLSTATRHSLIETLVQAVESGGGDVFYFGNYPVVEDRKKAMMNDHAADDNCQHNNDDDENGNNRNKNGDQKFCFRGPPRLQEPWFVDEDKIDLDESSQQAVLGVGLLSTISFIFTAASLLWTLYAVVYYGWLSEKSAATSFSFFEFATFMK